MIRTSRRLNIARTLLICLLVFIWGNSLMPGEISGAISDWVKELLAKFLPTGLEEEDDGGHLIRKLAHFTEFACLGLLLTWLFGMMGEKKGHLFCMPLLFGMMAACMDETIQVFTPDRGPSPIDIWIDTCGVAAGIMILILGYYYICKKNTRKLEEIK